MTSPPCDSATILRSEAPPREHPDRRRSPRAGAEEPLPHEPGRRGRPRESSTSASAGLPRNLVGLKIVVVHDDVDSLEYFAIALQTCGAEVVTASTAVHGVRLLPPPPPPPLPPPPPPL